MNMGFTDRSKVDYTWMTNWGSYEGGAAGNLWIVIHRRAFVPLRLQTPASAPPTRLQRRKPCSLNDGRPVKRHRIRRQTSADRSREAGNQIDFLPEYVCMPRSAMEAPYRTIPQIPYRKVKATCKNGNKQPLKKKKQKKNQKKKQGGGVVRGGVGCGLCRGGWGG